MSITAAVKSSSKSAFKEPAYSTVHSVLSASPRTCSSCSRWQASHRVALLCGKMHPKQPESWHSRRSRESLALARKGKTEAGEAGTSVKSFRSTTPTLYQQPIQLLYSVLHSGAKPASEGFSQSGVLLHLPFQDIYCEIRCRTQTGNKKYCKAQLNTVGTDFFMLCWLHARLFGEWVPDGRPTTHGHPSDYHVHHAGSPYEP